MHWRRIERTDKVIRCPLAFLVGSGLIGALLGTILLHVAQLAWWVR